MMWGSIELAAINVAACIPAIAPLFGWATGLRSRYVNSDQSKSQPSSDKIASVPSKRSKVRSPEDSLLGSTDDSNDRNIYHFKPYEISIENQGDKQSDTEVGTKTKVFAGEPKD